MNTSKSLADIRTKVLVHGYGTEPVIYEIGLDAEAKQAIVEAVEGLKFSKPELGHLLHLLEVNEREGWYFGNKEQYWKRSERIKAKLEAIKEWQ